MNVKARDTSLLREEEILSPYKSHFWRELTPRERLRRSWELRRRLSNPQEVHDRKLFPKP